MRFRSGVVVGFGVGYYYGSKAGRAGFEKVDRVLRRLGAAESVDLASDKAKAVIDMGVERARDLLRLPAPQEHVHQTRGRRLSPPADPSLN